MSRAKLLIFTDLDGTLLDHENYGYQPAVPAIERAKAEGVPIIPCTSKTLAESLLLQHKLGLVTPIIFENGAGVALPKLHFKRPPSRLTGESETYYFVGFGMPYEELREHLVSLRRTRYYHFKGFGDMTPEELAEATKLPPALARLAQKRRHSEPLQWLDDAKSFDEFRKDVRQKGMELTRGGRFVHVLHNGDKGRAMLWVATLYEFMWGEPPFIAALGDSENDVSMLAEADFAAIIHNPHKTPLAYQAREHQRVYRSTLAGPAGWNEVVQALLEELLEHG